MENHSTGREGVNAAPGLKALEKARVEAAQEIAAALQRILPPGFRAKLTITVDRGVVRAQDVAIELRPQQQ